MTKIEVVKLAARLITAAGTTTVTNSIIRNNVAPTNLFQQISVGVAAATIGSMASEATKAHTERRIDEIVASFAALKTEDTETPDPIN